MAAAPWGQSGNCQSGSEWHHTLALATLATAGNCHWGPEWLPHGYLWLIITFYFLYKNEMIRWFPCGTWRHSGSFIVMKVWGCTAGFIVSFCHFYQNYLFWNNCFLDGSMWFLLFLAPLC